MSDERIGSTLFLAALIHGVIILGVTFTAVPTRRRRRPAVAERHAGPRHRARGARGRYGGFPRQSRPARRRPSGPRPTADEHVVGRSTRHASRRSLGRRRRRRHAARGGAERRAAREPRQRRRRRLGAAAADRTTPAPTRAARRTLIQQAAPQRRRMELALRAELPSGNDDARTLLAHTEHAPVGARRIPGRLAAARRAHRYRKLSDRAAWATLTAGRPTLEVVIAADGRLDDIVVRRSSGDKALDQAALQHPAARGAVRAAAAGRSARTTTSCGFAYEWDFAPGPKPTRVERSRRCYDRGIVLERSSSPMQSLQDHF